MASEKGTYDEDGKFVVPDHKELKIVYPHKKYQVSDLHIHISMQPLNLLVFLYCRRVSSSLSTGRSSLPSTGTHAVIGASKTSTSSTVASASRAFAKQASTERGALNISDKSLESSKNTNHE